MASSNIIVLEESVFEQMVEAKLRVVLGAVEPRFFLADEVLTTDEAAKFLKYSKRTIQKMIQKGELVPHRLGNDPRFLKSELFQLVKDS